MKKTKKVLLLVGVSQKRADHLNWFGLRDLLRAELGGSVRIEMSALTRLTFVLHDGNARIFDVGQGFDVREFDLVVFRTIGDHLDQAVAVAAYCRKHHIRYIDSYIPHVGKWKMACGMVRWEHGLGRSAPDTLYGPIPSVVAEASKGYLGWPLVVKADGGGR